MSNHDKLFFVSHSVPPIQLRYAALLPISPPPVPFSRAAVSEDSIRSTVPHSYSVWRDAMPPPSSSYFLSDWRGSLAHAPLPASLSVQSTSRLSLLASLSAERLIRPPPTIRFPIRRAVRMRIFRAHIRFPVASSTACDTLSIYMRAWWNGRHARFRFWWRNPCGFESHRPHHGNA